MSEDAFPNSVVCFGNELGVSRTFPESYQKCDPVGRKPARVVVVRLKYISAIVETAVLSVVKVNCCCQVIEKNLWWYMYGQVVQVDDVSP